MRGLHARRLCVRRIVENFSDPCNSMIVWFQFERQDGTHPAEATRSSASLMGVKYSTVTLAASQCLFFRGENDAGAQTSARRIIKADGYQVTIYIQHPDGLIIPPFNFPNGIKSQRDAVERPACFLGG